MKISVSHIPESGKTLPLDSSQPWVKTVVTKALAGEAPDLDHLSGFMNLCRTGENINLSGEFKVPLHPACDRCLEVFDFSLEVLLQMNLAPLYMSQQEEREWKNREEIEITKEDAEFSFYKGTEINLSEILREQTVLALPLRTLCSEECRGLCPRCGKNLNEGNHECN